MWVRSIAIGGWAATEKRPLKLNCPTGAHLISVHIPITRYYDLAKPATVTQPTLLRSGRASHSDSADAATVILPAIVFAYLAILGRHGKAFITELYFMRCLVYSSLVKCHVLLCYVDSYRLLIHHSDTIPCKSQLLVRSTINTVHHIAVHLLHRPGSHWIALFCIAQHIIAVKIEDRIDRYWTYSLNRWIDSHALSSPLSQPHREWIMRFLLFCCRP